MLSAAELAKDELALMTLDRRLGEVRNLGVGDRDGVGHLAGETGKAGAEDDGGLGTEIADARPDRRDGLVDTLLHD